jgi:Fe-S cluster biogenesis protein NfuA
MTTKPTSRSVATRGEVEPLRERVVKVINLIRPAVQADGGDLELVGVTSDGVVEIRLHGACVGCPSSAITLQMGIERNLKAHIPEVKAVRAVA